MSSLRIAIVGSGFAGSLLARCLKSIGHEVVLIERSRHPRFALGESSTPLANLALERLAARYGLTDLRDLATWGRWKASHPELCCGLKRGFSFYFHQPGCELDARQQRLLVAASPSDRVADTHWLRSDVDAFFVAGAQEEGIELLQETEVLAAEATDRGVSLAIPRRGDRETIRVDWVIDASGPAGVIARAFGARSSSVATCSALAFGHFRGVSPLVEVTGTLGADWAAADPFPCDWAAQHHLLEEGWVYVLRFDDGPASNSLVSAGLLSVDAPADDPAERWRAVLARYPTLRAQFAGAETVIGIGGASRIQHRLDRVAGRRWVALPHTAGFVDPLFSTGIAWSLLGVERLARLFEDAGESGGQSSLDPGIHRYADLLPRELDQIDQLVAGAYALRTKPAAFHSHALIYFALVSYAEARRRLDPHEDDCWEGFLGADDRGARRLVRDSLRRGQAAGNGVEYPDWVATSIARWDVAGLDQPPTPGLYPADPEMLVLRAGKLGLKSGAVREALRRAEQAPPLRQPTD